MTAVVDIATGSLPPGQAATRKFPVVGERQPGAGALDLDRWRLEVTGLIDTPLVLTYAQVRALPQAELRADIHCVTGWSHLGMRLGGTPLRALLASAQPRSEARFVRFIADSNRGHDTSLPLAVALRDSWLIHSRDGEALAAEHGFPLRTVTPSRYFYKSLKWLRRIELLAADRRGYWERESSYHEIGDPWAGDQRFRTGSVSPETVERFRNAKSYARFRGAKKILIGVDLRGWVPATRDLGALHLKRCDLRGAQLASCDLRGANLSLSDLRGADLAASDLRGADLEGADFTAADLRGADLTGCALSATRFCRQRADGGFEGAQIAGLRWDDAAGLLEDQEAFLRRPPADERRSEPQALGATSDRAAGG